MSDQQARRPLRKQPKRQRMNSTSAVNIPQLKMPETANKRRRRKKTEPVRFGLNTLKRFVLSTRWLSLALLVVAVYALVQIYQDGRFYLSYIPVEGAVAISPEEIAEASGLAGSHVFAADPSQAARNIGALPGVISATVTLKWPNQVYIEVSEESPVAVWLENGVEYGVTSSGRLIPAVRLSPGLLQIESEMTAVGPNPDDQGTPTEMVGQASAGNEQAASAPKLQETALAFVPRDVLEGALQLQEMRPAIEKLYYKPEGGLSIQDGRGWRGYFGTGAEMNQKLAVYETIVADLLARGIQPAYISVSNQEKPYYKAQ